MIDDGRTTRVSRLARFAVTTPDRERLARFWIAAFGCREVCRTLEPRENPGRTRLALGESTVDILEFDPPGRPYPPQLSPFNNEFQHFAIVVSDMRSAYERLSSTTGWTPISTAGPQRLPASSGGVTAFKFRDPDGHPLEFLSFPSAGMPAAWQAVSGNPLFLGIDHSALCVADTNRSIAFYRTLGLQVFARSFNHGIEQQLLDGMASPEVDVIGLAPTQSTPHVELLCYRHVMQRRRADIHCNDVFASRLIFDSDVAGLTPPQPCLLVDPDGHHLEICPT